MNVKLIRWGSKITLDRLTEKENQDLEDIKQKMPSNIQIDDLTILKDFKTERGECFTGSFELFSNKKTNIYLNMLLLKKLLSV